MKPHTGNVRIGTPYKRKGSLWSLGYHTGDDWLTPKGTKAYAMADGRVVSTSYNHSYGNNIIIESRDNTGRKVRWSVNHLSAFKVKTGQSVKVGQVIGLTGATGHVTGPHDHVEARISPFTFAARSFVDPQVMYDVQVKASLPAAVRPKSKPARWFGIVTAQLAGMNDHGRATLPVRAPKIAAKLGGLGREVVFVQELPDGFVDEFDKLMRNEGFKRVPGGSDGRYIYVVTAMRVGKSGVFDLKPRYKNDDKQAAWAVIYPDGPNAVLVVNMHLESDDPADSERVGQAMDAYAQGMGKAEASKIPASRVVFGGDTNSLTWVRDAFAEKHFVDAATVAWRTLRDRLATWLGWGGKPKDGDRIDQILVHRRRPVVQFAVSTAKAGLSDHLFVVADLGKIT